MQIKIIEEEGISFKLNNEWPLKLGVNNNINKKKL
ncbi:hypothetical protein CM15mP35_06360 [bacterium]|nr:MAG: hypothetical protein CM15mP35_06360 [bacterium]